MTSHPVRIVIALLGVLLGSLLLAPAARADTIVAWDELVDGQLSDDPGSPTYIGSLGEGDNVVRGKVRGWADRFLFDVEEGYEMVSALIEITAHNGSGRVELSLSDLSQVQTLATTGLGILAFDTFANAAAGTYLAEVFGYAGEDPRFNYEWHLEIEASTAGYTPNPEPGTLALVGAGAVGLFVRRRRRMRQAS